MKDSNPNILLIYTGGTIGMIKNADTGVLKAFDFKNLLKQIPELKLLSCEISTVSFKASQRQDKPTRASAISFKTSLLGKAPYQLRPFVLFSAVNIRSL